MKDDLSPEIHEIETKTILKRLNVVVHPLWSEAPFAGDRESRENFVNYRKKLEENILSDLLPQSAAEATYVMPHIGNSPVLRMAEIRSHLVSTKDSEYDQWRNLFKKAKSKSEFPKNVILGPNLVKIIDEIHLLERDDPEQLTEYLKSKGYQIDEDTEVVVGGEMLNPCVKETTEKLLKLKEISSLCVDRDAVLTAGYLGYMSPVLEKSRFDKFKKDFEEVGYEVADDGKFINIKKRAETGVKYE